MVLNFGEFDLLFQKFSENYCIAECLPKWCAISSHNYEKRHLFFIGKSTSRNIIFLTFYFLGWGGVGWAFSFSRVFRVQMNVLINAGSKEFVWNYLGSNKTKENSRLLNKGCVFGIRNRQSRYGCRIPQEKSQQLTAALIKKSGLIF